MILVLGPGACVGSPPPPPVDTSTPATSTADHTTSGEATPPWTDGAEDGEGSPSGTTIVLDGGSTGTGGQSTSGSSEGPGSTSSGAGMVESSDGSTSTTGEPPDCTPVLAEVLYDAYGSNSGKQWVKLYNPCLAQIDLTEYSLGWGGISYTDTGTADLLGAIEAGGCFLVGGPSSDAENYFPLYSLDLDFSGDLENSGGIADGIALFVGDAASITAVTVPVDAVIYGDNNSSNLIDAEGNIPDPHVADAPEGRSIRRTALTATWVVEPSPMPNDCPAL